MSSGDRETADGGRSTPAPFDAPAHASHDHGRTAPDGTPPAPDADDEAELLLAARSGDRAAFAELWRRHAAVAERVVRPFARSDAEDVVSEAFESLWEQLQRGVGPQQAFRPYLLRVARNIAARRYREQQWQLTNVELDGEPTAASDEPVLRAEEHSEIVAAFRALPERWQRVLWLSEVDDAPRARVAEQLELSPNAVSVTLRRAREGLRLSWLRHKLPPADVASHPEVAEALPRYVRGSLPRPRARTLDAHLRDCPECTALRDELRREDRRLGGRRGLLVLLAAALPLSPGLLPIPGGATAAHAAVGLRPLRATALLGGAAAASVGIAALIVSLAFPDPLPGSAPGPSSVSEPARPAPGGAGPGSARAAEPSPATDAPADGDGSPSALPHGAGPSQDSGAPGSDAQPGNDGTPATEEPDPDPGPEPGPDPEPDPDPGSPPATLTVQARDTRGGSVAPRLVGTAEPGSAVAVTLGEHRLDVHADTGGAWQADLASLPLPVGAHTAVVSQAALPGEPPQRVSFSLSAPEAELSAWPEDPGAPGVFPPFVVGFSGIPGASVCARPSTRLWTPIELDAEGRASTPLFYAWPFRSFGFGYCDGDRLGPASSLPTVTSAAAPAG
ncbi:sigma-70 family RNA polymerase sigma factor [Leucobacter massiliensis]|nr:sigma-70 family RNA polymerase sigma factor [Leucobacter massiliensis]